MQSLDRIYDLLRTLASRAMPPTHHYDSGGELRVVMPSPTWEDLVALGTDEIRHAGSNQIQVLRRLRALLLDIRDVAPPQRHPPLSLRLAMLDFTIEKSFDHRDDRRLAAQPDVQGIGGSGPSRARG